MYCILRTELMIKYAVHTGVNSSNMSSLHHDCFDHDVTGPAETLSENCLLQI